MFVAINYISCRDDYRERFETLFATRARAIDRMPGFRHMQVLKPKDGFGDYLIISHWDNEDNFQNWTHSSEFIEGHKRGFADIAKAKQEGKESPLKSIFKTYNIIAE